MKVISRKSIIWLLVSVMLAALLAFGINLSTGKKVSAADDKTDVSHYFYNQLGDDGPGKVRKEFYHAMEAMHKNGLFVAGEDYDLVENGHVTQQQLEAYAKGDNSLVDAMGAARDAFYTDYADIFYVDFGYLSVRVTQDSESNYHAYLGTGRADTYYTTGFDSKASVEAAIDKYNQAVEKVVSQAKLATPTEEQKNAYGNDVATKVAQMQYVHGWIAENTIYKLEATCTPGNEGHVRTPYGVFVAKHDDGTQNKFLDKDQGEALCEGYSRAFKVVMDKLGIPCVLVNGIYRHGENQEELHMWCHVELDGEWYAVDQTFDDINRRSGATGVLLKGLGNAYTEDYFLKGYSLMNTQHATSAYKSEAEYPFTYPQLAYHNLGSEVSTEHGAMIKVEQEPFDASLNSTNIKVSVFVEETDEYGVGTGYGEWCSYAQAVKKGIYLVVRYEGDYLPEQIMRAGGDLSDSKYENDNSLYDPFLRWAYVNPVPGLYGEMIEDCDGYTIMRNTSKPTGFEFAVTTVAPHPYDPNETDLGKIDEMMAFLGDPTIFVARSGFIKLLYGDAAYNPPPFIVKATPSSWGKLSIGKGPYHIEVEYDQWLKLPEGEELQMSVIGMRATGEFVKGTNAVKLENVVIGPVTWDRGIGDNETGFERGGRISFTFNPSPEYAHDNIMYYFSFNLVGENSGKQVNDIEYCAGYESDACCYKANGFHWSVYAQPQLIESGDLSTEGWKTSDGTDLSETKSRLALVVTSPSKKQDSQMNDLLEDKLDLKHNEEGNIDEDAFASFTYNISLTICKGVSIETGQGVRIGIGFPEDFPYESSMNGVVFKAYHFIRDAYNNVVDVEELEVTVTPLGLIITCYSFSPFAIVAVKGEAPVTTDKTVIIANTAGGTARAEDGKNLFKVKEGETRKVTITANEGQVIESVKIGTRVILGGSSEMVLQLKYEDLDSQNVLEANFVSKKVTEKESKLGRSGVVQLTEGVEYNVERTPEIKISVSQTSFDLKPGENFTVTAEVSSEEVELTEITYQWYRGNTKIEGQTGTTLTVNGVEAKDAGHYILKASVTSGTEVYSVSSETVKVSVAQEQKPADNNTEKPKDDGKSSEDKIAIIILGVAGGLVVVAVIVVVAVVIKKRR